MKRFSLLALVVAATGCGPSYLTPDLVREHLDAPKGQVGKDTLPRAAAGFFEAKSASQAEAKAFFVKGIGGGENGDDGTAGFAAAIVASGTMQEALDQGAAESASDVLCAASLVANISEFDACERGENCEVDLTIDSCVMRLGEEGDPRARGKIHFKLKNTVDEGYERTELRITFEDFQSTRSDEEATIERLDGIIALETSFEETEDTADAEVIFSADVDLSVRKSNPAFMEDPILERQRITAAVRFVGHEDAVDQSGRLEILCFVDETDDARDESVAIILAADSHRVDDSLTLANASLEVRGSNGSFTCTFSAAEQDLGPDGERTTAEGNCVDENGDTFTFSSTVTEGGDGEA